MILWKIKIFNYMKKLIFLLLIMTTLSSCYMERELYVHRHPWNGVNRVHRYYVPHTQYYRYKSHGRNW
jgi:hypothetical protein